MAPPSSRGSLKRLLLGNFTCQTPSPLALSSHLHGGPATSSAEARKRLKYAGFTSGIRVFVLPYRSRLWGSGAMTEWRSLRSGELHVGCRYSMETLLNLRHQAERIQFDLLIISGSAFLRTGHFMYFQYCLQSKLLRFSSTQGHLYISQFLDVIHKMKNTCIILLFDFDISFICAQSSPYVKITHELQAARTKAQCAHVPIWCRAQTM